MAQAAATVHALIPSGSGQTVDVLFPGGQDVAAFICYGTNAVVKDTPVTDRVICIGASPMSAVTLEQWTLRSRSLAGGATTAENRGAAQGGAVYSNYDRSVQFVGAITGGLRFQTTNTFASDQWITVFMISADAADATFTSFDNFSGANRITITPGFEADLVLTGWINNAGTGNRNGSLNAYGIALKDGTQRSIAFSGDHNVSTSNYEEVLSNVHQGVNPAAPALHVGVDTFTATTFDCYRSSGANDRLYTLAVRLKAGVQIELGESVIPISGAWVESGFTITPDSAHVMALYGVTAANSVADVGTHSLMIAGFDTAGYASISASAEDNIVSSMVANSVCSDDLRMLHPNGSNAVLANVAPTMQSGGWSIPLVTNPTKPVLTTALVIALPGGTPEPEPEKINHEPILRHVAGF